jgi:hypothetical protein
MCIVQINIMKGLGIWRLTPDSTLCQINSGGQFYWGKKPKYQKKITDLLQATGKLYHIAYRVHHAKNRFRTQNLIPILCKDLNWQEMHSLRIQLMLSIFLKCHKKWWKMLQNICNKCRFPWQPAQIFRVWKILKKITSL